MTPTIKDYENYLSGALNYMGGLQLHTVLARFNIEANQGNPQQVFEKFIDDYGNEFSSNASDFVQRSIEVSGDRDTKYVGDKIEGEMKKLPTPKFERNPLVRIESFKNKVAANIKKLSVSINGREFTEQAREVALRENGTPSHDKIKDKYNYSSEGSFGGKKLTLELVVKK